MSRNLVCGVLVVMASQAALAADLTMKVVVDAKTVSITDGDRPVLRYRYGDVKFKPYVDELRTPSGVQILRDAPHDHLHHHGLMFAVAVDGVNYWEEKTASGKQNHRTMGGIRIVQDEMGDLADFKHGLDWHGTGHVGIQMYESRVIRTWPAKKSGATVVMWRFAPELPVGKSSVSLGGANYYGLGARFLQSMDSTAKFFNAEGKTGVDGTHGVTSNWCAMTAMADGKPVTYAMFDHKDNPLPITWFTMTEPFAYMSATAALDKKPIEMKADQPLVLAYFVAVWDGHKTAEEIARFHGAWMHMKQTTDPGEKVRK
jgi:hypothetical protein